MVGHIFHTLCARAPRSLYVCRLVVLTALALPFIAHAQSRNPSAGDHGSDFTGLYVRLDPSYVNQAQDFSNALSKSFVDGAAIMVQWAAIEPSPGNYDFAALDRWVVETVKLGKSISLGVQAGSASPTWLYDAPYNVPKNNFDYNRNPQGAPLCTVLTLPSPWNDAFINQFAKMTNDLARHLRELQVPGSPAGAAYNAVRIVKLTGINNTTEELRLVSNKGDNGPCHQSNAQEIWAAAGFTPERISSAFTKISDDIATAYPNAILSLDVIKGSGFPPIDSNGRIFRPMPQTDLSVRIIELGRQRYSGKFSVQWNALSQLPPNPAVTDAGARGAIVAWQLNEFLGPRGGTGCIYDERRIPCQSVADFDYIIDNGINNGAAFIEIWAANVDQYAASFQRAHDKLKAAAVNRR
jgi:hypothetical protein